MGILSKSMRKFVLDETKKGYTKETRDRYFKRIREEYASNGIKDLTLLAQNLPESELAEIFKNDVVLGLFRAILFPNSKVDEKEREQRRKRLLLISRSMVGLLDDSGKALLSEITDLLTKDIAYGKQVGLRALILSMIAK